MIGFNNPGGMNYSLVVAGDVASATVTAGFARQGHVHLHRDRQRHASTTRPRRRPFRSRWSARTASRRRSTRRSSAAPARAASSPGPSRPEAASSSPTADSSPQPTATPRPRSAASSPARPIGHATAGSSIGGGCDNAAAGTDIRSPVRSSTAASTSSTRSTWTPASTPATDSFVNNTGAALTDVNVALSFSGAGASKMSVFNSPIHIGPVAGGRDRGRRLPALHRPDGQAAVPDRRQPGLRHHLARRTATRRRRRSPRSSSCRPTTRSSRQNRCSTFNTLAAWHPGVESVVTCTPAARPTRGAGAGPRRRRRSSAARTARTALCCNSDANAAAMTGNSGITSGFNFNAERRLGPAPEFPAGAHGQRARTASRTTTRGSGTRSTTRRKPWAPRPASGGSSTTTSGTARSTRRATRSPTVPDTRWPITTRRLFDYVGRGTGTRPTREPRTIPTLPRRARPPNQLFITFNNVTGLATPTTYFAYGHEHADLAVFGGTSTATTRRDIAFDNDNLVYDEFYASAQGAACTPGTQVGQVAFDLVSVRHHARRDRRALSVLDANGVRPACDGHRDQSGHGGQRARHAHRLGAVLHAARSTLSTAPASAQQRHVVRACPPRPSARPTPTVRPPGSSTAVAATACAGGDVSLRRRTPRSSTTVTTTGSPTTTSASRWTSRSGTTWRQAADQHQGHDLLEQRRTST